MKRALLLGIVFAICSCGPTARDKALRVSYGSLSVATTGFEAWDVQHQFDIVDEALSAGKPYEEAQALLKAYHDKRDPVVVAVASAYKIVAKALLEPSEVTLAQVTALVDKASQAISALTTEKP